MIRGNETNAILRQFKKKSKKIVNKDIFTEFFYFNKNRRVVEFLRGDDDLLMLNIFFKKLLPSEFREFVELKMLNSSEEVINTWYYDNEDAVIVLKINWGFKKQEISCDIDIDNFNITVLGDNGELVVDVDCELLNEFIISFLTIQARNLSESFSILTSKKSNNQVKL